MNISLGKYKFMYLGIQVILLGIVVYKLSAMGLLPVSAADYVDLVPPFEVDLGHKIDNESYRSGIGVTE